MARLSCSIDTALVTTRLTLPPVNHACLQTLAMYTAFMLVLPACLAIPQECQATDNLWVCLICGSVLCGSRHEDHVGGHYTSTLHAYAIEIGTIICFSRSIVCRMAAHETRPICHFLAVEKEAKSRVEAKASSMNSAAVFFKCRTRKVAASLRRFVCTFHVWRCIPTLTHGGDLTSHTPHPPPRNNGRHLPPGCRDAASVGFRRGRVCSPSDPQQSGWEARGGI